MAASSVKHAFGTLLKKGSTTIAEITSISGPGMSREEIDVTHHESPNTCREKIGGLADPGVISIEGNFLPANATQTDLYTELFGGTADTWSIVWIDGPTTWSFSAFVSNFEPEAPVDGKLSFSFDLTLTGMPTFPA